jgi:hypothetical protein
MKKPFLIYVLALGSIAVSHRGRSEVLEMAEGAKHFLASLTSEQQAQARFSLRDKERLNWHYIPRQRKGVAFGHLDPAQRKVAHALLATGLSRNGYQKASRIMYLEQILYNLENGRPTRDPDAYFFSIFGEPSSTGDWGWRVEGHHLSLNFTIQKGEVISSTPSFFGANPAEVREGPQTGLRSLAAEEDLGRRLFQLFSDAQREKVLIDAEAPAEIITGADRKAEMGAPVGVAMTEMTREQSKLLMALLEEYAHRLRPERAEGELRGLRKVGVEKIHFAWAGESEPGQPHYYRIQGPTFIIEYDNIQNNANHIHTVWRDFDGDFGLDLLGEHHARSHPPGGG